MRTQVLFAGGIALIASLAWSAAPSDPWTLVPALPTGCYDSQDPFADKIDGASRPCLPIVPRQRPG